MIDQLAQRMAVAELYDTGVSLSVTLDTPIITADDVRGALTQVIAFVEAMNLELQYDRRLFAAEDAEFYVAPEVYFERGSLRILVKLKSSLKKMSDSTKQALATLMAACIMVAGQTDGPPVPSQPEPPQITCSEGISEVINGWQQAQQDLQKYDKEVSILYRVECEGQSYEFRWQSPKGPES